MHTYQFHNDYSNHFCLNIQKVSISTINRARLRGFQLNLLPWYELPVLLEIALRLKFVCFSLWQCFEMFSHFFRANLPKKQFFQNCGLSETQTRFSLYLSFQFGTCNFGSAVVRQFATLFQKEFSNNSK